MGRIKYIVLSLGIFAGFVIAISPITVGAVDVFPDCTAYPDSAVCKEVAGGSKINDYVTIIVNTLLYILGAVAVFVIILSGISYVTSTGDPGAITKAKSTLTYAVIGLVVALLAYAIVNFVILKIAPVS